MRLSLRAARAAYDRLRDALIPDFEVISGADADAAALIVIGSSYPDAAPAAGQRVFTVTTMPSQTEPDVRIARLRMPTDVPRGTLIHIEAGVDAMNVTGATSTLTVRAGRTRVEVARATHTWTKPSERWLASMDVTPIDSPPWLFHVDVSAASGERALIDNAADDVVQESDALRFSCSNRDRRGPALSCVAPSKATHGSRSAVSAIHHAACRSRRAGLDRCSRSPRRPSLLSWLAASISSPEPMP